MSLRRSGRKVMSRKSGYNRIAWAMLTILFAGVCLCGGKTAHAQQTAPAAKIRIAILNFGDRDGKIGEMVKSQLTDALGSSGRFTLIDKGSLPLALQQIKVDESGVVDPETMAKIGRVKGVDYILYGSVVSNSFDSTPSRDDNGRITGYNHKANITVHYVLSKLETLEVKVDKSFDGDEEKFQSTAGGLGSLFGSSAKPDPTKMYQTGIGETVRPFVIAVYKAFPMQGKIAKVDAANGFLYVKVGTEGGLKEGTVVRVFGRGGAGGAGDDFDDLNRKPICFAKVERATENVAKLVTGKWKEKRTGLFGTEKKIVWEDDKGVCGSVKESDAIEW